MSELKPVPIRFELQEYERLHRQAHYEKRSKAEIVREALNKMWEEESEMEKKVRELLEGIENVRTGMRWSLWQAGAYLKNGEVHLYASYHGQGLDTNVHNKDYDEIADFTDIVSDEEYDFREKMKLIVERIESLLSATENDG